MLSRREPLHPPAPGSRKNSVPDSLTRSFSSLSLRAPHSSSSGTSQLSSAKKLTPSRLSRRASSMDFRPTAGSSPGSDSPRRQLSNSPSTPAIRKRTSLVSLNGQHDGSTTPQHTMKRRSSILSMRGSPSSDIIPRSESPKDLTPPSQDPYAETAVILHDSSYKHRYARPKTSMADLDTIVERPERIPAAVLGICAAQIRGGKERLSIRKTTRMGCLSDPEVMLVHAHTPVERAKKLWPDELTSICNSAADKLKRGQVEVPNGYHQGDLYLCGESLEDLEGCVGAVYEGVDVVFGNGPVKRSFVCIRPPGHHCAENQPSGFCWLNNVHIAIAHAAKDHGLTHAVILDFDLHHGDGSQAIAWSINELAASGSSAQKRTQGLQVPTIGYFSLHDINSYPCEYGDRNKIVNASLNLEAHGQFVHNVHLKPYASQEQFWQLYEEQYSGVFAKARQFLISAGSGKQKKNREFKAGIFLSAGFDASEHESPGMQRHNVNVPTDFFAKFTADAVSLADELCGGRVLSVLEGGYSDRALTSGVFAHVAGLSCVPPDLASFVPPSISLAPTYHLYTERQVAWQSEWWALPRLEELERLKPKVTKRVEKRPTSYMDSTAASQARAESAPRRVLSTSSSLGLVHSPPPKPWEVQAYELSQCFTPAFEEAKPIPAVPKAEKAKRHTIATAERKEMTMRLRGRKPKTTAPGPELASARSRPTDGSRPASRAPSRATTPALNNRISPARASSTGVTGVAGPRQTSSRGKTLSSVEIKPSSPLQKVETSAVDVNELRGKLAKVKLTYNKEKAEREQLERESLENLERQKVELEKKLEAERQKVAASAMEKQIGTNGGIPRPRAVSVVASARQKLEANAIGSNGIPTKSAPHNMRDVSFTNTAAIALNHCDGASEVDSKTDSEFRDSITATPDSHSSASSTGEALSSSPPPIIEINGAPTGLDGIGNGLGHFHGIVNGMGARPHSPKPPSADSAPANQDRTYRGGEIRFGIPFGAQRAG